MIVADDGSDDGTAEMAESFEAPYRLRVLRLGKAGKSAALNAAIEAAGGEVCVFLDDDVIASPELVAVHLEAHRGEPLTLGIGPLSQRPPTDGHWFGCAHAEAWNERYEQLAGRAADWPDCYGGNFSAPLGALGEVGGFATELAAIEDIELGYRLCAAGCLPRYLPAAGGGPRRQEDAQSGSSSPSVATVPFAPSSPSGSRRPVRSCSVGSSSTTPREVTLRRLFLALRLPPAALAPLGGLIPGTQSQADLVRLRLPPRLLARGPLRDEPRGAGGRPPVAFRC